MAEKNPIVTIEMNNGDVMKAECAKAMSRAGRKLEAELRLHKVLLQA